MVSKATSAHTNDITHTLSTPTWYPDIVTWLDTRSAVYAVILGHRDGTHRDRDVGQLAFVVGLLRQNHLLQVPLLEE